MDLKNKTSRFASRAEAISSIVAASVGSYDERLLVDVVQVQREDVVLAAHVHAVVVLVHQEDAVVGGVEQEGEVVSRASGLQLC